MTGLVDSHCHLDFPDFAGEIPAVLARAEAAGVSRLLTICTRLDKFADVLAVAESDPRLSCSVGIHPHEAGEAPDIDVERLVALARHGKVVGIGEAGLDYHYDKSPREAQRRVFAVHIEAARQSGLPLIVHTREAEADTLAALRDGAGKGEGAGKGGLTGVIHCFTASKEFAAAALDLGFYISFSGILTFKNAEPLREAAKLVPRDRLLIETDAPYLAPAPLRGKRNEPAFIRHTAQFLADLLGLSLDELAGLTSANFDRLFAKAAGQGA